LAPYRSASRPHTTRPPTEASPATPITVAAAIGVTPQSMASVTMWKIGPEWATQQAKWVRAMAANCGERSAPATLNSGSGAAKPPPEDGDGGLRTKRPAGTINSHAAAPSRNSAVRQS
jgi:hypothetical protein